MATLFARCSSTQLYCMKKFKTSPIELQHEAIQCPICHRCFHSKGGIAVHKCQPAEGNDLSADISYTHAHTHAHTHLYFHLPPLVLIQACHSPHDKPTHLAMGHWITDLKFRNLDQVGQVMGGESRTIAWSWAPSGDLSSSCCMKCMDG